MCIIAYSSKGHRINKDTLCTMFNNNSDGAGIMYLEKDVVQIIKGLMTAKELVEAYKLVPKDAVHAVHCRIATSGKIVGGNTHPFVITNDYKKMQLLKQTAECALMHNGVLPECVPQKGMKDSISDTMIFTHDYIYPLRSQLKKVSFQKLVNLAINNSRLLIFDKNSTPIMLGSWQSNDGIFYSNSTYKPYTSAYNYYNLYYNNVGAETLQDIVFWCTPLEATKIVQALGDTVEDYTFDVDNLLVTVNKLPNGDEVCGVPYSIEGEGWC